MGDRAVELRNDFDARAAQQRCADLRRRVLDLSQRVSALHVGGAFSCTEMVDCIFNGLMTRPAAGGESDDTFLMSKGHSAIIQYVILESLGILRREDVEGYCTPDGILGVHPDRGNPGITASTGSLGHGLGLSVGMALADKHQGLDRRVFVLLSDGELQEGSSWEAALFAPSRNLSNLILFIDANDMQGLDRPSEAMPNFYPIGAKFEAFGWEAAEVDGHDSSAIFHAVTSRKGDRPFVLVGNTIKGKGVSFMEHVAMWHYRSPSPEEYTQALQEIEESLS